MVNRFDGVRPVRVKRSGAVRSASVTISSPMRIVPVSRSTSAPPASKKSITFVLRTRIPSSERIRIEVVWMASTCSSSAIAIGDQGS